MEIINNLLTGAKELIPATVAIVLLIIILYVIRIILDKRTTGPDSKAVIRQLITMLVSIIGLLAIIMLLPISDTTKGQLLSLIGILLSAAIALSSATIIGNIMASFMLRAIRGFKPGDFIKVENHFGRVTERGLFHTEIQTIDRDLTTLPNIYLVTHPVKAIRSSGTIVYSDLSLGYDIPRTKIEKHLLQAALDSGLEEPFVQIMELGDFSVTYRVAGLLKEVKNLITARSHLRKMVLDNLHQAKIEIVSPTFMNTKAFVENHSFIPVRSVSKPAIEKDKSKTPEKILFDKADGAETLEEMKQKLLEIEQKMAKLKKELSELADKEQKELAKKQIEKYKSHLEMLTNLIKRREEEQEKEE